MHDVAGAGSELGSPVDPRSIHWLADAADQLLHAIGPGQLPPADSTAGPLAVCGRTVLARSLLDDPRAQGCPWCELIVCPPTAGAWSRRDGEGRRARHRGRRV